MIKFILRVYVYKIDDCIVWFYMIYRGCMILYDILGYNNQDLVVKKLLGWFI